jgi:hypothetical protein
VLLKRGDAGVRTSRWNLRQNGLLSGDDRHGGTHGSGREKGTGEERSGWEDANRRGYAPVAYRQPVYYAAPRRRVVYYAPAYRRVVRYAPAYRRVVVRHAYPRYHRVAVRHSYPRYSHRMAVRHGGGRDAFMARRFNRWH